MTEGDRISHRPAGCTHGQNLKWTTQYLRCLLRNGSPLKPSNQFTLQL